MLNVRTKKMILAMVVGLISATASQAGVRSSGGGRALVCREDGKITSARMLDVLEGLEASPIGYGLKIAETNDISASQDQKDKNVDAIISNAVTKFPFPKDLSDRWDSTVASLLKSITDIRGEKKLASADEDLIVPEDVGNYHIVTKPKNCKFEAVGVYQGDGKLYVNPEIYFAMDSTNQAAFFLHEGIYAYYRAWSAKYNHPKNTGKVVNNITSEVPREAVADFLSSSTFTTSTDGSGLSDFFMKLMWNGFLN